MRSWSCLLGRTQFSRQHPQIQFRVLQFASPTLKSNVVRHCDDRSSYWNPQSCPTWMPGGPERLPVFHQPLVGPLSRLKHHMCLLTFGRHRTSPAWAAVTTPAVEGTLQASVYVTESTRKGQMKAKGKASLASQTGSPQNTRDSHPHKHSFKVSPLRKKHLIPNSHPAIQP